MENIASKTIYRLVMTKQSILILESDGILKIVTRDVEIIMRRLDLPEAYIRDSVIFIAKTK